MSKDSVNSMGNKKRSRGADRAVAISAASLITGVEVHTLRYWEREFADFLQPLRTEGGQRRYRPEDIQTLFTIKRLLRDEMFSIAGARKYLIHAFQQRAA
jgi:DNA-binding transcriptional MerR regulator